MTCRIEKTCQWLAFAFVAAGFLGLCGCKSSESYEDRYAFLERFTTPQAPLFINGPGALLLTNWERFSCHANAEMGTGLSQTGELFGRDGKLLFAIDPDQKTRKNLRGGGFSFLWDVKTGQGYVLSDPLQGIAVLNNSRQFTNMITRPGQEPAQKLEGLMCEPEEVVIFASDGSSSAFTVWRAREARNFPMKITSPGGAGPVSINFSKVRFEAPPAEAFESPEGFTKYPTPESLVSEYITRQQMARGLRRPAPADYGSELGVSPR